MCTQLDVHWTQATFSKMQKKKKKKKPLVFRKMFLPLTPFQSWAALGEWEGGGES
jgi:hypothetical protein